MPFEKEANIAKMLKTLNISQYDLSNYYTENEKQIGKKLSSIFEYLSIDDIEYLYILLELKYPDSYESIFEYFYKSQGYIINDFEIENKESKKMDLLALMAYNNEFYANAVNWCAFTKFEKETVAVDSSNSVLTWDSYKNANINKQNKLSSFFSASYVLGLAASSEKERVMNIGKPRIIEGYGTFSITGREVNSKKMANFHFVFDNPDKKITVEIKYKTKNMGDFVSFILKSSDLKDGKTELRKRVELDYEKEFDVEVTIFTEE